MNAGLVLLGLLLPGLLVLVVAGALLIGRPLPDRALRIAVHLSIGVSFLCFAAPIAVMISTGEPRAALHLGDWFTAGTYRFELDFILDRLSVPYACFTTALAYVVASFALRYLRGEPGYQRFFLLFSVFVFGMLLVVLAGAIEVVIAGWEMVGLASALLVAFFNDRPEPVRNGLFVYVVYRISDLGLIAAAVVIHHALGTGSFDALNAAAITRAQAEAVGFLLLFAAMGKCALLPFSGWLARAMEGPTPSSAIFYGALSVHAGAYLLLRAGPVLDQAPAASIAIVGVGLLTASTATLISRTQPDIKTALAYASLTQIGLILAEIGAGLRTLALVHIVAHATVRSLELLRAPSLIADVRALTNAIGAHPRLSPPLLLRVLPASLERRLYRLALGRADLDDLLVRYAQRPFTRAMRAFESIDRWICDRLGDPDA